MKTLRITLEGRSYDVTVQVLDGQAAPVAAPAPVAAAPVAAAPAPVAAAPAPAAAPAGEGTPVKSPMAGLLLKLSVKVGDTVAVGQEIGILEAMKMESSLPATVAGKVTAVLAKQGDSLAEGQTVVTIA